MEKLDAIARLSQSVIRVLGQNPGKFTLQGTNTYILGTSNPYILLDTGEGLASYIPVLESALTDPLYAEPKSSSLPDISDIILSHWHNDHVGGLPSVLTLLRKLWDDRNPPSSGRKFVPPKIHKFPVAGAYTHQWYKWPDIIGNLPNDSFTPAGSESVSSPIHDLHDLQKISFSSSASSEPDADSNSLVVLHTPGHTEDSICLYIPSDGALYTADSVLGAGTAVFEDLSTYMSSLQRMLDFDSAGEKYTLVYPGHGPVLKDGKATISMYIKHRLEREAQILELLHKSPFPPSEKSGAEAGKWTTWTLVTTIYASYPESLWLPAARGVELHLKKLEKDGVVKRGEGEGLHCTWELTGVSPKNE